MASQNTYGAVSLNGSVHGTASHQDHLDFGEQDFEIEVAFAIDGGSGARSILSKQVNSFGWGIGITGAGKLNIILGDEDFTSDDAIPTDEWQTLSISGVRSSETAHINLNGEALGTLTIGEDIDSSADLVVGEDWVGRVSEVRITIGRIRHKVGDYLVDVRQFVDDNWTMALYHFNEGEGATVHDMSSGKQTGSHSRNHLVFNSVPTYTYGVTEACVPTIIREQVWLALDSYTNLDTFLSVRNGKKYRWREGDIIPGDYNVSNTPALIVAPGSLPDIRTNTPVLHKIEVPVGLEGHLHHTSASDIEYFWWLAVSAIYARYNSGTTAGRFNFSRIQNMISQGPSFTVQEQENDSLFSSFTDTLMFTVDHDFYRR